MQLISEMGYDEAFAKQAEDAGYVFRDGAYHTPQEIQQYENIPYNMRTSQMSGGLTSAQVKGQIAEKQMRAVPGSQQQYAIKRQEGLSGTGNLQQLQSLDQRNIATAEALANAKMAPGPGRSIYDQRLNQMMTGSFSADDPSYRWRVDQGMENLGRSAAAKGMLGSGNLAAELLTYGQNMASQEYGAQFNRLLQASNNATSQYTAAYSVLDRMLAQQQSQQNLGLEGERMALGWAGVAQQWGNQNLGYAASDTSRFAATSSAANQAGGLNLERDRFRAQEQRLDNWNAGQGQALTENAGRLAPRETVSPQQPVYSNTPSVQYSTPSQGSGYVTNSSGVTTSFGGTTPPAQAYQPFTNDYGYEAVYGD